MWGVVKANAYGHGLIGLLPIFDNWVDGLALLDPKEGVDIRKAGWAKAVLLIEGILRPLTSRWLMSTDLKPSFTTKDRLNGWKKPNSRTRFVFT